MLKQKLERAIEIDKRMKNINRCKTPYGSETKRKFESENSSFVEFNFRERFYRVIQDVDCSYSRPYYSMTIFENGVASRKGIKFLETVLGQAA